MCAAKTINSRTYDAGVTFWHANGSFCSKRNRLRSTGGIHIVAVRSQTSFLSLRISRRKPSIYQIVHAISNTRENNRNKRDCLSRPVESCSKINSERTVGESWKLQNPKVFRVAFEFFGYSGIFRVWKITDRIVILVLRGRRRKNRRNWSWENNKRNSFSRRVENCSKMNSEHRELWRNHRNYKIRKCSALLSNFPNTLEFSVSKKSPIVY